MVPCNWTTAHLDDFAIDRFRIYSYQFQLTTKCSDHYLIGVSNVSEADSTDNI